MLVLPTNRLFTLSFPLFPYASWWSMLRVQGHAFAELALPMPGGI
ncbi:hypothetical protein [Aeromonas salmonicida]|nr:hypothetical protein [Aeromonas salmonicida]